jgi:hypothetical protein
MSKPQANLIGQKTRRGVPSFYKSQINLNNRTLSITTPPRDASSRTPAENEITIPLSNVISATLDFPDNSHCKWVSGAFGFLTGVGQGALFASAGGNAGVSAAASTVTGGLVAGISYGLCTSRKAVLTVQTARDDHIYAVSASGKEQALHMYRALKESL